MLALGAVRRGSHGNLLAGGEAGVYAWSGDGGESWVADSLPGVTNWYGFAEHAQDADVAAAAPGMLASTDAGLNWRRVELAIMPGVVYDVAADGSLVYVAGPRGVASFAPGTGIETKLYDGPAYRLCATPYGVTAATQNDGIILFTEGGMRWGRMNQGLPEAHFAPPDVCRIALSYHDNRLYFGNCGLPGLWSIDLSNALLLGRPPAAKDMAIESVWPQPLGAHGWISIRAKEGAALRIALRDLLGRELRLLHDGPFVGDAVPFRLDGVAAGTYVLDCRTGTAQAHAVVLVRK